jgi:hypothetical protein
LLTLGGRQDRIHVTLSARRVCGHQALLHSVADSTRNSVRQNAPLRCGGIPTGVARMQRGCVPIRSDNLCGICRAPCIDNVKVHSGSPWGTYSPAAGNPRPVRSIQELIDEYAEQSRHPDHPMRCAVVRGRRRSCATAPRPAVPSRSARSATAPPPWAPARGARGLQEREQRPAMQLYLTARRSGQRNMPCS